MDKIKTMFMSLLWYTGALLEVATIPLSLAVLHEISITYEWFIALKKYQYVDGLYYITAALTMFIFSILVMINRHRKNLNEMLLALICFIGQVVALSVVLIAKIY